MHLVLELRAKNQMEKIKSRPTTAFFADHGDLLSKMRSFVQVFARDREFVLVDSSVELVRGGSTFFLSFKQLEFFVKSTSD